MQEAPDCQEREKSTELNTRGESWGKSKREGKSRGRAKLCGEGNAWYLARTEISVWPSIAKTIAKRLENKPSMMIPTALGTHVRNWIFGGHIKRHSPVNLAILGVFAYGS